MTIDIFATVPKDYDEAFARLYSVTNDDDRKYIRNHEAMTANNGMLGATIRYEWNLWGTRGDLSTVLRDDMTARFGLGHAEDLSLIMLENLWAKIHGDPFDAQAVTDRLKQGWIDNDMDPLTLRATKKDPIQALSDAIKALTPPGSSLASQGWTIAPAPPGGYNAGAGQQAQDPDDDAMVVNGTVYVTGSTGVSASHDDGSASYDDGRVPPNYQPPGKFFKSLDSYVEKDEFDDGYELGD